MPPCCFAMLLIISMRITVLPTPAPPKRPILPPLGKGTSRSTTLMPVSSSSTEVFCSTKLGASRWMGRYFSALMGPISSTGRPTTFMMRPRDAAPTGAMIGLPVSTTSMPRTKPSVASMAMVRTTSSPRCWATSQIRSGASLLLGFLISRAVRMFGK